MRARPMLVASVAVFAACSSPAPPAETTAPVPRTSPMPGAVSASPPPEPVLAAAESETAASFRSALAELIRTPPPGHPNVFVGADGFLFFVPELRHVAAGPFWGADAVRASTAPRPADRDPLPAILDFARQLRELEVELLVVPVPAKVLVYPELLRPDLPGPQPRLDENDREFLELLERSGVRTLDLLPQFIAARDSGPFCRQDTHWSGRGLALAAARIAERVRAMPWYGAMPKTEYASEERELEIGGDLWRDLPEPRPGRERLPLRFVGTRTDGLLEPVAVTRDSPILLLGDSHALVFHAGGDLHARGAGLPDALALELGMPVDVVAVRGSGATPARLSLRRRGGPAGKRLVIWCFSVRELTEGQGWKLVPMGAPDQR